MTPRQVMDSSKPELVGYVAQLQLENASLRDALKTATRYATVFFITASALAVALVVGW